MELFLDASRCSKHQLATRSGRGISIWKLKDYVLKKKTYTPLFTKEGKNAIAIQVFNYDLYVNYFHKRLTL